MKNEKYLVTIEFRYRDALICGIESESISKTEIATIGVYDDFYEACKNGNKLLEKLESRFVLHKFPQGNYAKKERFSKNGGSFGSKKTLISNLAYLKTPFDFYAKITTLNCGVVDETINNIVESTQRYREYKLTLNS